ncbi:hypothetical protein ACN6MT_11250 [Neobacillus niacini]|uniref:hypothetical protein n=1 Tax=Neobacillus niacini TaxID=86668 RepID=UPI003B015DBA
MNRFDNLPDVNSFEHLHEAVAYYTRVVAKAFRCTKEDSEKLMEWKAALHERIKKEHRNE